MVLAALSMPAKIFAQAGQISAPTGTPMIMTNYPNPALQEDPIFIFCSPDANGDTVAGTLSVAGGYVNCTYHWTKYNPTTHLFEDFGAPITAGFTTTITGLASGFYQCIITCNAGTPNQSVDCRRAHVFINSTVLTLDPAPAGCAPFDLTGGQIGAVSDFTVYEPPNSPFVVDANTVITVCFSGDHTYVSDLGFYLVPPTGGRVDLLPSVSAWDDGAQVTTLPPSVLSCTTAQMNTNCNSGNNFNNFCFTSSLPQGNPAYTACICDMATPLSGTFASAGPWTACYGDTASQGGWAVQVYDCVAADVGFLSHVTLTFVGMSQCGQSTITYDSGQINSGINDNSCTPQTASIYVVPLMSTSSYVIHDSVTAVWSSSPTTWNSAWGSTDFAQNHTPHISPIPTTSTTFYLTVHDHLYNPSGAEITGYTPCTPVKSSFFNTNPTNSHINTFPANICSNAQPTQLIPQNWGGTWTATCGTCISGGGFFFPNQAFVGPNNVTYTFGGVCPSDTTVTINVAGAPSVTDLHEICNGTNTLYQVIFTIVGGNPAGYSVINNSTGLQGGTIGAVFTSYWLSSPSAYSFNVTDNNNCNPTVVNGYRNCGCHSNAGTMPQSTIVVCQYDPISSLTNGDTLFDSNDGLEYYLHTQPFGTLGTPATFIAHNNTGQFFFNSNPPYNMVYGQTYYISAVVGNNIGTAQVPVVDLTDPCLSVSVGTPVKWMQLPTADAGADTALCGNTIQLNATTPSVGMGTWSNQTTAYGAVTWTPDYHLPNVTVVIPGYADAPSTTHPVNTPYTFRWTVTNGPCSVYDETTITFKPQPHAFAGNDTIVCGLQATLCAQWSLGGPIASHGYWTGVGHIHNPVDTTCSLVDVQNPGTYNYVWTEFNQECVSQDIVNIQYLLQPHCDANHNDSVCGTAYNLNAISTMGTGYWTGPAGTYFQHINLPQTPTAITYAPGQTSVTDMFTWHEANSFCTAQDSVFITFSITPNAAAGFDDYVCGHSYTFDADVTGFLYATGTWSTTLLPVTFDNSHNPNATVTFPNTGSMPPMPPSGSFGDTSYLAIPFIWVMDNNKCTDQDTVVITFYQMPTANAGVDTSVCGLGYDLQANYSIGQSSGKWTLFNGPTGVTFSDDNSPHSHVTADWYGTFTLVWKEWNLHNPTCFTTDTVVVTFLTVPNPYAGPDRYICGQEADLQAVASTGFGTWLPNGAAVITTLTDPHSHVHCNTTGSNVTTYFVWQESNSASGTCTVKDTVKYVFMVQPVSNVYWIPGTSDSTVCGKTMDNATNNIIIAQPPADPNFNAYWIGNDATFIHSNQAFPDSVVVNNYGMHEFNWVIENHVGDSVCRDTSATIYINFIEIPVANAGGPTDTACGRFYHLHPVPSVGTGLWTPALVGSGVQFYNISGTDTTLLAANSDTIANSYAVVSFIDYNTPQVIGLTWTENNQNHCKDKDTIYVTFAPRPTGLMDILYTPHCIGMEAKVKAKDDYSIINYNWQNLDNGVIDSVIPPGTIADPGQGPLFIVWPNAQPLQCHYVTLITENRWLCYSPNIADTICEPEKVRVGIDDNPGYTHLTGSAQWYNIKQPKLSFCGGPNGEIFLYPANTALVNNYHWIDSLSHPFLNFLTIDNKTGLMPGYYSFWASAKSLVPPDMNIYCRDTFNILIRDHGYIGPVFKLDNLADTTDGIASTDGFPVKFDNLTFLGDTVVHSTNGRTWDQLSLVLDPTPLPDANGATYQWDFILIPWDSLVPGNPRPYPKATQRRDSIFPWENPEPGLTTTDVHPTVKFTQPGYYKVKLTAISTQGCVNKMVTGYIFIDQHSKITPGVNIFTPNGDGINDLLEFETATLQTMHGEIFSRWGKKIYDWTWNEVDQKPAPNWWDGKINGNEAPPGVYFYVLSGVGKDGKVYGGADYCKAFYLVREKK
ncbi:MAG: gliding motility-associated C-terminal domain-containing protein [Bacteroidia bacterium]|nr:gliding motility-associated C-terminal domain-containing protein [Bacteroidia bacterium]